jgi:hypothetical protein
VDITLADRHPYTDIIGAVSGARLHVMRSTLEGRGPTSQRRGDAEDICSLIL